MKTTIKVSEQTEIVAFTTHGLTIKDLLQDKIIAIVPEELDSLITALSKAKELIHENS